MREKQIKHIKPTVNKNIPNISKQAGGRSRYFKKISNTSKTIYIPVLPSEKQDIIFAGPCRGRCPFLVIAESKVKLIQEESVCKKFGSEYEMFKAMANQGYGFDVIKREWMEISHIPFTESENNELKNFLSENEEFKNFLNNPSNFFQDVVEHSEENSPTLKEEKLNTIDRKF